MILKNFEETQKFGEKLGALLISGDIVCLNGDLGAGKTSLTQGIGKGLEVEDYITSPTFALINEYKGRLKIYHFDVYRLENVEEVLDLGFDDYFYSKGVSIIEWANSIEKFLPEDRIEINISAGSNDGERVLELVSYGKRYDELKEELLK